MWREWFSAKEIAAADLNNLPSTVRGINKLAEREGWRDQEGKAREIRGRGRPRWEYHLTLLPIEAQILLILLHEGADGAATATEPEWRRSVGKTIDEVRQRWKQLQPDRRDELIARIVSGRAQ